MKDACPVLRGGRESIVAERASALLGCGGSLTNTQEDGGGSPAGLVKNQWTHAMTADTKGPALLALTLRQAKPGGGGRG